MFRHTFRIFLAAAMLIVVPVGQTHDENPPNTQTAGGANATEWSGIDPKGAHATAEAEAWAGKVPKTFVIPNHHRFNKVPLKRDGDSTIWEGECYDLRVRRDECRGSIEYIGQPKEKKDVPLRIEVRRVENTRGRRMVVFISTVTLATIYLTLPVPEGIYEKLMGAGVIVVGGHISMLSELIGKNEINHDVEADGNSAYQYAELEHDPVGYGDTVIRSESGTWGKFAGDSFNVSRESHTHVGVDLHPDP